jgi:arylsulfatase A-like enzyme
MDQEISDMHLIDQGWNALREQIVAHQKKLGVIAQDAELTTWPNELLKSWDALTSDEKRMFVRQADVHAAYLAYTDHKIGRLNQSADDMGKLDDALIIYISGDNGPSGEGTPNEVACFNGINGPSRGCGSTAATAGTPRRRRRAATAPAARRGSRS